MGRHGACRETQLRPDAVLQSDSNVVVLHQIKPSPRPPPSGGNELMLPRVQPNESPVDRLPVIGSAKYGPGKWSQALWFRGSGSATSRRQWEKP